jgi:hypothetical protein
MQAHQWFTSLTEAQQAHISGGFNPQPEPPASLLKDRCQGVMINPQPEPPGFFFVHHG